MTIKAENLEMRPIADRQWVDQCPPGDRREVKHESGTGCITWVVDRRGPVMDASLEEMAAALREVFEHFADASEGTADPAAAARLARLLARGES